MFISLYQQLHYSTEKAPAALEQLKVTCPPMHKGLSLTLLFRTILFRVWPTLRQFFGEK